MFVYTSKYIHTWCEKRFEKRIFCFFGEKSPFGYLGRDRVPNTVPPFCRQICRYVFHKKKKKIPRRSFLFSQKNAQNDDTRKVPPIPLQYLWKRTGKSNPRRFPCCALFVLYLTKQYYTINIIPAIYVFIFEPRYFLLICFCLYFFFSWRTLLFRLPSLLLKYYYS